MFANGHVVTGNLGEESDWGRVLAFVGPHGAGKTDTVSKVCGEAAASGVRVVRVDLRDGREIDHLDEFYTWLSSKLRESWGNDYRSVTKRLDWCDSLERALTRKRVRVLLAFDNLEAVADWCARDLILNLREVQDRSAAGGPWARFRCVLAGVVSVFELRRRADSPNLQFVIHRLPSWASAEAIQNIHSIVAASGCQVSDGAVEALQRATGGELSMLRILTPALMIGEHREFDGDQVTSAVRQVCAESSRYPELSVPAALYLLDDDFRRRADDLLDGRRPSWCDPASDIDPYQLHGALVFGEARTGEARFRNGMVERVVHLTRAAAVTGRPVGELVSEALGCPLAGNGDDSAMLLAKLGTLWSRISGTSGHASLILRSAGRRWSYVFNSGASSVPTPGESTAKDLVVRGPNWQVRATRTNGGWTVDTELTAAPVVAGVRVHCEGGFVPSVAMRESCRLWGLLVATLSDVVHRAGLRMLGLATLSGSLPIAGPRVFVSSTYRDLVEHRRAVVEQILRRDMRFRGMEHFGADPEGRAPAEKIVEAVRQSDVYVGIFGMRYGYIDAATGKSMTQLELEEAESRRLPMLLYVLKPEAQIRAADVDDTTRGQRLLKLLIGRIRKQYVVQEFENPTQLAARVFEDLGKLE